MNEILTGQPTQQEGGEESDVEEIKMRLPRRQA